MSDPFAARLRRLKDAPPPQPFPAADEVRRRGRRRARRQAVAAAGVTCLVIVTVGVTLASMRPQPAPRPAGPATASPTGPSTAAGSISPVPAGPAPTSVQPGLLLHASDLPGGGWAPAGSELFAGPDLWYWADACAQYRSADYPSLRRQVDVGTASYTSGSRRVDEIVELYPAGWGTRNLADVGKVVTTCAGQPPSPRSRQSPAPAVRTVIGTGLAGDESVLVRVEQYAYDGETIAPAPALVLLVAVVRVADAVATVVLPGWATREDARTIAAAAAGRLTRR
jgi:hypothetical protein